MQPMAQMYAGAEIALLTQHGKQRVIAPALEDALGCRVRHVDGYDTDLLGTFTRDIPRFGTQAEAARKKACIAMELAGGPFGLGSEGAFVPDPFMGMAPWNVEVIAFIDYLRDLEVVGVAQGRSNFHRLLTNEWPALDAFAREAGFPDQQLAVRPGDEYDRRIRKGIHTWPALKAALAWAAEDGWVIEETAAAAMVFGGDVFLKQARPGEAPLLSLSVPGALDLAWLESEEERYGAVASDADGNGPYRVWSNGRVQGNGRSGLIFDGVRLRLGISQGARPLSEPMAITQVDGHDILTVANQPALANLAHHLPQLERELSRLPLHLFMAGITFGDPEHAVAEGRYHLLPLISANADDRSVTVPVLLSPGDRLFWALRQPPAAEQDMRLTLDRLGADTLEAPEFGPLFSCQGRGAGFYGGDDRDLALLAERYPGLPLIGFYGNGEIAHLNGMNRLLQYSAVLGLAYV